MSAYVISIHEMGKKLGYNSTDFVAVLKTHGFDYHHLRRITQAEVDSIMQKLNPPKQQEEKVVEKPVSPHNKSVYSSDRIKCTNANIIITRYNKEYVVSVLDTSVSDNGELSVKVIDEYRRPNKVEALIAYDQLILKYNFDSLMD
jgi:hypothetical protein